MTHPSTSFLLFNSLAPLTKDPATLARLKHAALKPLIGDNPYDKAEEQLIAEYNSTVTIPQLVFLGLDERDQDGLSFKSYRGAPVFVLDVTPRGTVEEAANEIIADVQRDGLTFLPGRVHMTLNASDGKLRLALSFFCPPSCYA